MIVKPQALDKINVDANFFLFYGKNEGLKSECIKKILKIGKKQNVFKYDEKQIQEEKENFFENVLSNSLFENEKTIIINHSSDKIHDVVRELIDRNIKNIKILINSGVLEKKSKLRSLFEKNKKLVCIPFYKETDQSLMNLAIKFCNEKKIQLSNQLINLIIKRAMNDRHNLKNELKKIETYSLNKKKITEEDILKLTNISENYSISVLIDNCLIKNEKKIKEILNENNFSLEECIQVIRTFLFKSKRLLALSIQMEKSKNIDTVIAMARPPIFWKDKEIIKKQLKLWSKEKIKKLIQKINLTEASIKKNSRNSIIILIDFIFNETSVDTNNIL